MSVLTVLVFSLFLALNSAIGLFLVSLANWDESLQLVFGQMREHGFQVFHFEGMIVTSRRLRKVVNVLWVVH